MAQEFTRADGEHVAAPAPPAATGESTLSLMRDDLRNDVSMFLGYGLNWTSWQASTAYSLGVRVRPTTQTGYVYECTTAGTSDAVEPASWATTIGNTTSDGTVTWTCRKWTADEAMDIDRIINAGLRQFYAPPLLPNEGVVHRWSFLAPTTTLTVFADTEANDGTLSGVYDAGPDETTLTASDGMFDSDVAGLTIIISGIGTFTVASYESDTEIVVSGDATCTDVAFVLVRVTGVYDAVSGLTELTCNASRFYSTMPGRTITVTDIGDFEIAGYTSATVITVSGNAECTDKTFSVAADGDYRLPHDFGHFIGDLTYGPNAATTVCRIVSDAVLRQNRQSGTTTGPPVMAAIRPLGLGGAGQRFDMACWPEPDSVYSLYGRYSVLANALTGTAPYPYGGMAHAETIRASVLACAELDRDGTRGAHWERFMERLAASIAFDRAQGSPDTLGVMGKQEYSFVRTWRVAQAGVLY